MSEMIPKWTPTWVPKGFPKVSQYGFPLVSRRFPFAFPNAFPAGTDGLSAMLEKGLELAAALQRQDTVCALQERCVELGNLLQSAGSNPADEAQVKDIRKKVCEMLGREHPSVPATLPRLHPATAAPPTHLGSTASARR